MEHKIEYRTYYCTVCGAPATAIIGDLIPCTDATNVIAISHIISARRLGELTGVACKTLEAERD